MNIFRHCPMKLLIPFGRHVFYALSMLSLAEGDDWLTYPLWRNGSIQIVFCLDLGMKKRIRCINDLIDDEGKFLTREQCEQNILLETKLFVPLFCNSSYKVSISNAY